MFNSKQIEKNTKIYTNRHEAFRALLGGIGTGNISLDNTGAFNDFEVLNHPDKGLKIPYTFFIMQKKMGKIRSVVYLKQNPGKSIAKPWGILPGIYMDFPEWNPVK